MTRISMRGVSKYFDAGETVANYRIDLDVDDGEFLVLLGPSGCGKTTALRIVAGLETPSEGDVYFDDERVTDHSPSERNVAMVFQNYALYPHMSVRENIAYPLKVRGVPPDERDRRIEDVTELLHIEDLHDKSPAEISGGQRQRTALARAIVREPSVFLLDEPLSNLDAKLRQEMRVELKRIQDELGVTTIYVTHNQEEAMSMADRVAVMNRGTIRQIAPPAELYERPRTEWVARFIGSPPMNLLRGTRRDGALDLGDAGAIDLAGVLDDDRALDDARALEDDPAVDGEAAAAGAGTVATVQADGRDGPGGDGPDDRAGVAGEAADTPGGTTDTDGAVDEAADGISVGVRPEDFSVETDPPAGTNAVEGQVDTVEPLGEYTLVNVSTNDQLVNAKVPSTDVERGDRVFLTFDDKDAYLYDEDGRLVE